MPQGQTRAFVLRTSPLNEQDKLVELLSMDRGIIKAIAPGSQKAKNRFGSLLELFTEGEFFYYWKENKEMVTLSKGELLQSYFETTSQADKIFYIYVIAEILLKFTPHHSRDKRIYRLVASSLKAAKAGRPIREILLYFMVWILRIEGFMFNPTICYNCFTKHPTQVWVKADFRGILCSRCRTNEIHHLTSEELNYIKWTEKHSPQEELIKPVGRDPEIGKMIRILKEKLEHHGECTLVSVQYLPEFN